MTDLTTITTMLASGRLTSTALADGSGVLLDVNSAVVLTLNATGQFLVEELLEGNATSEGLARRLVEEFEVDETTARADVTAFVAELGALLGSRR